MRSRAEGDLARERVFAALTAQARRFPDLDLHALDASGLEEGSRFIRQGNGTCFVLLRVAPTEPPAYKRNLDPASCRDRFRAALLGAG